MQVRTGKAEEEVNLAIAVDERVTGTGDRASYIRAIAERGGLTLAFEQGRVVGFCCCDSSYFFEKPFVSLLIVAEKARRLGLAVRCSSPSQMIAAKSGLRPTDQT